MVRVLLEIQTELDFVCKGCAHGKNVKHSFPNSDIISKGFLDIMHSNICGPMSEDSLSGYVYYVSFIDDYPRKTWISLLKENNDFFWKIQRVQGSDRKIDRVDYKDLAIRKWR
jgi:hypothetical protein